MIIHCQSGIRPLHSTKSTVHNLTKECFLGTLQCGEMAGTVYIDLSEATDSVKHTILIDKLKH